MQIEEYQQYVKDGASPKYDDITFAIVALMGEVGEVADVIKKLSIYPDSKDNFCEKIIDEASDLLWQYTALLNSIGISYETVINHNVEKLNARHGGAKLDTTGGKR